MWRRRTMFLRRVFYVTSGSVSPRGLALPWRIACVSVPFNRNLATASSKEMPPLRFPCIQFRHGYNHSTATRHSTLAGTHPTSSAAEAAVTSTLQTPLQGNNQDVATVLLSDLSPIAGGRPPHLRPRQLSDDEVDWINSGGVSEAMTMHWGQYRSKIVRQKPTVPTKSVRGKS